MRRLPKILVVAVVAATVLTFLVMALWNWLAPALFKLPTITAWQALGLLVLSKILFGGFRGGPGGAARDHWRRRMMERLEHMTPDERDAFRRGVRMGVRSSSQDDKEP